MPPPKRTASAITYFDASEPWLEISTAPLVVLRPAAKWYIPRKRHVFPSRCMLITCVVVPPVCFTRTIASVDRFEALGVQTYTE